MLFGNISIYHYIVVSFLLFGVGIFGILSNKNSIMSYILSLEIAFLGLNLCFVAIARFAGNVSGQGLLVFILAITAAEVSLIISAIILHYKRFNEISVKSVEA